MAFFAWLSSRLDHLVRPEVHIYHRSPSAFHVCGLTGLALAIGLAMTLVWHGGLSPWVMGLVILAAMGTFLALAMATKIATGRENLVYYYHEIAVLTVAAVLLWLLRQPVLAYLDATILGVGMFLACGRVGCLMVGCCHGRPHAWGVCYRPEHAEAGFPDYLVGVRLFPIQAIESAWVLGVVAVGSALVWSGQPPGTALAWYVVMYDLGRFSFEFMRGDAARPYWGGFSEAQWISVALMAGVVAAEAAGVLPFHAWHAAVAGLLLLSMLVLWLRRRSAACMAFRLRHPRHVEEMGVALHSVPRLTVDAASPDPDGAAFDFGCRCTSLGVQLSASCIQDASGPVQHYAFSFAHGVMPPTVAQVVAELITQLRPASGQSELVAGQHGVYHLLVHAGPDTVPEVHC